VRAERFESFCLVDCRSVLENDAADGADEDVLLAV
jgi:hypothetical protein